ncbi:hypothetical protein GCM10008107_23200 [Psychrosphaera saromensis]|uniref:Schlafen AlbA-2 domain-containing protein n=1 Tax=Psychrosphaera saromensis TaxID=716813 RepID=A0A2S7USW0_9GAMM|nr:RNA-binding domain-containing protein [Psychrosphaera saromensis]PQJ52360.1 hypothetical protein BTO11_00965 [Psychrosphaera saromensis]GHB73136.1 hypothetical protein GCM10008107_23200 [Psychrosphaera saromensis]GLQ13477.1 hypothetical protein GCM10007917_09320 [Psychrosphaera saromensis]
MTFKNEEQILDLIRSCGQVNSDLLENEVVEFKEYRSLKALHDKRKDLSEEIAAFANHKGGTVIVGIKDGSNVKDNNWSKQLVGTELGDPIIVNDSIQGNLQPRQKLRTAYHAINSVTYLSIQVERSVNSLVSTSSGKYMIRDGRSSRPLQPHEVTTAINNLRAYDWTSQTIEDIEYQKLLDVHSISAAYADYVARKDIADDEQPSLEQFLEAIGVTSDGKVTKAGLLFLGKSEQIKALLGTYEYRFSWIKRNGTLKVNEVWDGNLWDTNIKAKKHFDDCNSSEVFTFKSKSYTCKLLDVDAFHEGFLNSLVHRDYMLEGMVSIEFDSTLMTITNPGCFFGGVSPENITNHHPRHRNKALANLMMNFNLVDRAGMGVKRMGLGSLKYGREFPTFKEANDTVEVAFSAKALIPAIFVITVESSEDFGLMELILINSLYKVGHISVSDLLKRTKHLKNSGWQEIKEIVEQQQFFELCGNNSGVYVKISKSWSNNFGISKNFKVPRTSEKYVKLYDFLNAYGEATNEDVSNLLNQSTSHTSLFLKNTEFAKRLGNGPSSKWVFHND